LLVHDVYVGSGVIVGIGGGVVSMVNDGNDNTLLKLFAASITWIVQLEYVQSDNVWNVIVLFPTLAIVLAQLQDQP